MKKLTQKQLNKIVRLHGLWLFGDPNGVKADLSNTNLSGLSLWGANLSVANLSGADLSGVDLDAADLSKANLYGADISRASLVGADLSWADLSGANLSKANLSKADLFGANLSRTSLSGATISRTRAYNINELEPEMWKALLDVQYFGEIKYPRQEDGTLGWLNPDAPKTDHISNHDSMFHHLADSQVNGPGSLDPESKLLSLKHLMYRAGMAIVRIERGIKHSKDTK